MDCTLVIFGQREEGIYEEIIGKTLGVLLGVGNDFKELC